VTNSITTQIFTSTLPHYTVEEQALHELPDPIKYERLEKALYVKPS
jgi:hypothetical protein